MERAPARRSRALPGGRRARAALRPPTSWYDHVRDTKIRALLAAGRAAEAYALVHEVLARDPTSEPLADLAVAAAYFAWRDLHA